MKKSRNKSFLSILAVILFLILTRYGLPLTEETDTVIPDGNMTVSFLDVGQGDATLFRTEAGETVLIDTSTGDEKEKLYAALDRASVTQIDYLILTHMHEDHIGNADNVILDYPVTHIVMPDAEADTKAYRVMMEAIEEKNIPITVPEDGDTVCDGELKLTFFVAEDSESAASVNDRCILIRVDYGSFSVLVTGDAETATEASLLEKHDKTTLQVDILKVGHHGSSTSSSEEFLDVVNPETAVISCGAGNSYGHPHTGTLNRLTSRGISYYRTDTDGTVSVSTDGETYTVSAENDNSGQKAA